MLRLDQVAAWILKYIIPEFRELPPKEIMRDHLLPVEPLRVGREAGEAAVYYDAKRKVRLKEGETAECFFYVNFEPHGDFYPGYPLSKRGTYYCCRMISTQLRPNEGRNAYGKLSKVYSIWICFNPPRSHANSITRISMHQESLLGGFEFSRKDYDLIEQRYLMLGEAETGDELLTFLNVLFHKQFPFEERKRKLEELGFEMEDNTMVSGIREMTAEEICYYDSRFRDGYLEGREEGRREGREEGREEATVRLLQKQIRQGMLDISSAAVLVDMTTAEFEELCDRYSGKA